MADTPFEPSQQQKVVISERNHPIRPKMLDKDAVFVMRKLNKAGFSSYLVGGGVRDLYLGKTPKDFDISTDARPGQIRKLFPNSSTIGRRFRLVQVFFKKGKIIEVSTLRSLSEHDLDGPAAVLAPNNTYGDLPQDAQRRDLTINSLFYELENNTIIDHVGGVTDLDNSVIRLVGQPDKRINRDPVRIIRALRHSARTGFEIEKTTWDSICKYHHMLPLCPPSRIRDELFKDLYGGASKEWFKLAVDSGMFYTLFPFYSDILFTSAADHPSCKVQLENTFALLDEINQGGSGSRRQQMPHFFILALIMLPWAQLQFNLPNIRLKGPTYYQLSKKVRREIDNHLGIQLNLRKSIRQEMVTLLCNLPQFVRFVQNNSTPKWLKKKSYYERCLLFYEFYIDATSNQSTLPLSSELFAEISHDTTHATRKSHNTKKKSKPAFAPMKKGGVFGFRK